jgi:hypothetical protein
VIAASLALAACSGPAAREAAPAPPPVDTTSAAPAASAAPPAPPAPVDLAACPREARALLLASPRAPFAGAPLRFVAVTSDGATARLVVRGPDGATIDAGPRRGAGPFFWLATLDAPRAGAYRAGLADAATGALAGCVDVDVAPDRPRPARPTWGPAWPVEATWTAAREDLYAAWIEALFDGPDDADLAWPSLDRVLRDPARNFLHDHLGAGEDDAGPRAPTLEPDCADFPYFIRAYFAHQLGLPFGFSTCTRGAGAPPACDRLRTNLDERPRGASIGARLGGLLRVTVADAVHSGNGRARADDDASDLYPVRLDARGLRPGAVYADPYGHTLVVAKRLPQTPERSGVLFAVDAQPDGTVARRRFWRGNFLFDLDPTLGSPGFKRFRPIALDRGRLRALGNGAIAGDPAYGDVSLEQYEAGVDGFYDRVEDVLSPSPVDATRALLDAVGALEEQVRGRVRSVDNAERYKATTSRTIDMPEGAAIFETVGPWEDLSTPSRDLRLLVALDVVKGFPARVARRADRYATPPGASPDDVRRGLEERLARELEARRFAYTRSDGSTIELRLRDVLDREDALTMAYNPNDCVERRWGAPDGSDEAATCRRRAPGRQVGRMLRARGWFQERKRPPRAG